MKIKMCIVVLIGMIVTTNSFSQKLPSYVPQNGLVGYWPFNGNINDESGNGNNGEIINDENGSVKFVSSEKGDFNSAIEFSSNDKSWNAKSAYIKIPNSPSLSITSGYTINLFVKISRNDQSGELINKGPDNQNCFFSRINGNKNIQFGSIPKYLDKNIDLDTTKWIMLTMVKNTENDSSYLFIDGIMVSSSINSKSSNNNYDFWFGLHQYGSNGSMYPYQGKMDDVSIWNRPLSINEIDKIRIACQKQTASTTSFDKLIFKNDSVFPFIANPTGGKVIGKASVNNMIDPALTKLGKNHIDYVFKNESGCEDTTRFNFMVYDTLGVTCTKLDTITIKKEVFDTVVVNKTKYDTITIKNTIFDTITIKNTVYDTVSVTKNIYDTIVVKTNVYDTIKVTNTVTLYDTIVTKTTVTDTLKIKVRLTTGLFANQQHLIQMYPNPTASDLVIDFGNQEMMQGYSLTITDLNGKQVHKESIQTQKSIIKLSSLGSKGIYFVNILDQINKVISVKQIVLE